MNFERTRKPMKEINLTALIDIVFHLMVFVMLTTTFVVSESMELSLPSAHKKGSVAKNNNILRIQVLPDSSVLVDEQAMDLEQLSSELGSKLAHDQETRVAIFTKPGVNVQQLVAVMDRVYLTGGRNVQVDKAPCQAGEAC